MWRRPPVDFKMTSSLPCLQSPPSSLAQCWHYHRDNNVSVPCEISLTQNHFPCFYWKWVWRKDKDHWKPGVFKNNIRWKPGKLWSVKKEYNFASHCFEQINCAAKSTAMKSGGGKKRIARLCRIEKRDSKQQMATVENHTVSFILP